MIVQQPAQSSATIERQYEWQYAGREWSWTLQLPEALYNYYKQIPRPPTEDYSVYVTQPEDDYYLEMLVGKIKEAAQAESFNEWETVNLTVSFIQSLPYTSDIVTTPFDEYPRYPIETLVDNGGDCEDTSILMAAILTQMGYDVVLLSPPEHMAVGVLGSEGNNGAYWEYNGGRYFYLETTGQGFEIGEVPSEFQDKAAHIYDIVPVPVLTHHWEATMRGYSYVELTVTVENLGTATAYDVYVTGGFDAGNDMVWNPEESATFDLAPGHSIQVTMNLTVPGDKKTRLVVTTVYDDYAVDGSFSEWFDT